MSQCVVLSFPLDLLDHFQFLFQLLLGVYFPLCDPWASPVPPSFHIFTLVKGFVLVDLRLNLSELVLLELSNIFNSRFIDFSTINLLIPGNELCEVQSNSLRLILLL